MGPPDAAERRPPPGTPPHQAADLDQDLSRHDTPYDVDLFDQPVEPQESSIPRRGSAEYLKYLNTLPMPNGYKFWSLAPEHRRQPQNIESVWVIDDEGEHWHLFIDRQTGRQRHFDPEKGWSR